MKDREDHINTNEYCYQSDIPSIQPNCKCRIMVFMPDITKKLIDEYKGECKESLIWIN